MLRQCQVSAKKICREISCRDFCVAATHGTVNARQSCHEPDARPPVVVRSLFRALAQIIHEHCQEESYVVRWEKNDISTAAALKYIAEDRIGVLGGVQ